MNNNLKLYPIILTTLFISVSSCKKDVDVEAFSTGIQATFQAKDSTAKTTVRNVNAGIYTLYRSNDFHPLWIAESGNTKNAEDLIKELEALPGEGLPARRYNTAALSEELEAMKKNKNRKDINAVIEWDKKLTGLYVQAANDLMYGVLDPEEVTDMWYHDNDTALVFDAKDNKFPSLDAYRSRLETYKSLVEQKKTAGNDSTSSMIDANLERLRWLPQSFEETYIMVVVPRMTMLMKENNKITQQMKVVVGRPDRETPSLNEKVVNIVYNPSWGVPPGIMKKDVIPGLLSKGEGYLDKKNLKVYDRQGNEVDASEVTQENYKSYIFRQPPSERNALGQVKFNMPNPWDIYLHDTPSKGDFEKEDRYKSSGCVRLERALDLAAYVLKDMDNQDSLNIDEVLNAGETKYINLKNKLPVHIVYLTAYDDGNGLQFYKDIYNKDSELAALLNKTNK